MEHHHNPLTTATTTPDPEDSFLDSTCSTPYVSAPSSPGRGSCGGGGGGGGVGFFYSCPASPMHFAITSTAASFSSSPTSPDNIPIGYEFEFSSRSGLIGSSQPGSMSSADELFLNGKIRPMKLSTHLERPQVLAPLIDLENEEEEEDDEDNVKKRGRDLRLRSKSLKRRTRSMSPLRTTAMYNFEDDDDDDNIKNDESDTKSYEDGTKHINEENENENENENSNSSATTPSVSASSSRSSSAGRNSKRWVFLKDFLYRSKSEGRGSTSNTKFWHNIPFSISQQKDKKPLNTSSTQTNVSNQVTASKEKAAAAVNNGSKPSSKKPVNGVSKRRVPTSPHELHYKASRAQAEEMRKRTFLPYRQGLLGCLGFSSKSYGAMNGFARTLNPVSSR